MGKDEISQPTITLHTSLVAMCVKQHQEVVALPTNFSHGTYAAYCKGPENRKKGIAATIFYRDIWTTSAGQDITGRVRVVNNIPTLDGKTRIDADITGRQICIDNCKRCPFFSSVKRRK